MLRKFGRKPYTLGKRGRVEASMLKEKGVN